MHRTDDPDATFFPVDCFFTTPDDVVLNCKGLSIGCGGCFYACPHDALQ